jgi:hypothetical protein
MAPQMTEEKTMMPVGVLLCFIDGGARYCARTVLTAI